jgi:hypothetical protein
VPFRAFDLSGVLPLDEISHSVDSFPPFDRLGASDFRFTFDGLLTASNADGLSAAQRSYVQLFRTGIVEAVASSIVRGASNDMIILPDIEAKIVKSIRIYTASLRRFGVEPPFAVAVSLVKVKGLRFLQQHMDGAFLEDMPRATLDRDHLDFVEVVLDAAPQSYQECATQIRATLDHMANAAGLPASRHFDVDGNYTLLRDAPPSAAIYRR